MPSRNSPWMPGGVEPSTPVPLLPELEPPLVDPLVDPELLVPDPELAVPEPEPLELMFGPAPPVFPQATEMEDAAPARNKAIQEWVCFIFIRRPPFTGIVVADGPM
jgi:hypothetical protein